MGLPRELLVSRHLGHDGEATLAAIEDGFVVGGPNHTVDGMGDLG